MLTKEERSPRPSIFSWKPAAPARRPRSYRRRSRTSRSRIPHAIQSEVIARRIAEGRRLIGHKIGLTSKAMQQSSQIDEPDYGHLLDDMIIQDGAKSSTAAYCVPRVEPELAFVLGKPLKGPGINLLDVLRATEYIVPAIEIIDARVQNPRKIFDTVADNGAAAGIVLGGRPIKPMDVDLRWVGAVFYRNSEIEETGLAAGVLGHPRARHCLARQYSRTVRHRA